MKYRRFSFKDNQLPNDAVHANEVGHNPAFESYNISDGGLGWGGISDVFEQNQALTLTSVNVASHEPLRYSPEEEQQVMSPALAVIFFQAPRVRQIFHIS